MSEANENKSVPKLRFPEFKNGEEWENKKLSDIADRITEKVGTKKLTTVSISAGLGFVSQAEKFSRDISGQQYKNYIILKKGDFAYNKGNSKPFPQGCIYKLKEYDEAAASTAFICFRFKNTVVDDFYKGYFENNFHGKQIRKFITSGARMDGLLNVSPSDFFSIKLPTPRNKTEQQKIADCLSSLDEVITAESQKLEVLKEHKKGLLQNLFPQEGETVPKLRFKEFEDSGEWKEKKLGDIATSFSGGTPTTSNREFYGGDIPFIRSAEINKERTKLFITKEGLINSSAKLVNKGDVLIALYGANSGDVAISKMDGAINQAILCLKSEENHFFICQFLFLRKEWIIAKFIQGGQGNLSGDIVKSIQIILPSKAEQQKIAFCLLFVDDLINAQSQKIETLKLHKKGLLQVLFPILTDEI